MSYNLIEKKQLLGKAFKEVLDAVFANHIYTFRVFSTTPGLVLYK